MSQKNKPENDNNFFNKNPLITFALFSIIIIIGFKMFVGDSADRFNNNFSQNQMVQKKEISYSELKKLVIEKAIQEVAIGQTQIRGYTQMGVGKIVYIARRVGFDDTFIPLLDKNDIKYKGFNESNWFADMFGWMMPFLIIMGIWMLFANRMQKNMGGGILGIGSSKKLVNSERPKTKFADVAGTLIIILSSFINY